MRVMIDAYEAQTERMKLMGVSAPSPIQTAQSAPQPGQQPVA